MLKNDFVNHTAQEILQIFKDQHRICSPLDPEADPTIVISNDLTISEWRSADDLLRWRKLYPVLNSEFHINVAESEWKSVLEPPRQKYLLGVCELIAKHSLKEVVNPIKLLGHECLSAAVFLTLKKNLKNRGVDTSELRPSSRIGPYLEKDFGEVIHEITFTGVRTIDKIDTRRKKTGFWNAINIFDPDRYEKLTEGVVTFRDLVEKLIANKPSI